MLRKQKRGQRKCWDLTGINYDRRANIMPVKSEFENLYVGPHWSEPNVLAHVRFDDRVDADGKRVLFIEEIQSDWHQAGREKGYKEVVKELPPEFEVINEQGGYSVQYNGNGYTETISVGTTKEQVIAQALVIINRKGIRVKKFPPPLLKELGRTFNQADHPLGSRRTDMSAWRGRPARCRRIGTTCEAGGCNHMGGHSDGTYELGAILKTMAENRRLLKT